MPAEQYIDILGVASDWIFLLVMSKRHFKNIGWISHNCPFNEFDTVFTFFAESVLKNRNSLKNELTSMIFFLYL